MSDSRFKKNIEDFVCDHCGREMKGSGFTNHCPNCLYSKHVDIYPGDRKESCGGPMEPVGAEESGGEWSLIHKCQKCGKLQKNKISPDDNFDALVKIAAKN